MSIAAGVAFAGVPLGGLALLLGEPFVVGFSFGGSGYVIGCWIAASAYRRIETERRVLRLTLAQELGLIAGLVGESDDMAQHLIAGASVVVMLDANGDPATAQLALEKVIEQRSAAERRIPSELVEGVQ